MNKAHILLIGSFDKKFLKELSHDSWELEHCSDNLSAIALFESKPVDLVIARDNIDQLTGYQLCLLIKSQPAAARLPFILLAEKKRQNYSFNGHMAPYPDRIAEYTETVKKPQSLIKLIKEDLSNFHKQSDSKSRKPFCLLPAALSSTSNDDLSDKLLVSLLIERQINRILVDLIDRSKTNKQIAKQLAQSMRNILKADICGIAIASIFKSSLFLSGDKSLNKTTYDDLIKKLKTNITNVENFSVESDFQIESNCRSQISDLVTLPITSKGTGSGALIFAKFNSQKFTPVERTVINYIERYAQPLIEFLLAQREINDLQEQKAVRAATDPLTGVYSLEFLIGFLQQQLLFSFRNKLAVTILMVDLDRFSQVNEALGQAAGDMILAKLAERTLSITRSSDLLARYSSDKFVIVLPNTEMKGAKVLAEKLRLEIEQTNFFAGKHPGPSVTVSIGCAQFDPVDLNPETILKDAKLALQRAKEAGRNKVAL